MKLVPTTRGGKTQKYLVRGDSEGFVTVWLVPDVAIEDIKKMQTEKIPPNGKQVFKLKYFF